MDLKIKFPIWNKQATIFVYKIPAWLILVILILASIWMYRKGLLQLLN
jgi:hypothetical protein